MSPKSLAILVALVGASSTASAQTFLLSGEITNGTSLFPSNGAGPNRDFNEFGLPDGGYPITYEAQLAIDGEDWTFFFDATDTEETVRQEVSGPLYVSSPYQNDVLITTQSVTIDYNTGFASFVTDFSIALDLRTSTGSWSWFQDCPVCDLAYELPGAVATVTQISVIPEPGAILLAAVSCSLLAARRVQRIEPKAPCEPTVQRSRRGNA